MDGRRFDDLLRAVTDSRRSVLGGSFAGLVALLGMSADAKKKKKKKKPCKKKCKDGCCTGKHGKCIQPAQQSSTQCGTGGEICRSDCGGGACGANCATCCANGECVDATQISNEQCGIGGEACFACPEGQTCNAPGEGCCATQGAECGTNGVECCASFGVTCGPDNFCCVENGDSCAHTTDCCDEDDVCAGVCGRPEGASCGGPGDILCLPNLTCNPETLKCTDCPEEDICGDTCCTGGDRCYGTVCCPLNFGCSGVNGGLGSCCQFEYCCEPQGSGCLCEFPEDGCCG